MGVGFSNTIGLVKAGKAGHRVLNPRGENPPSGVVRTNVGVPAVALLTQETIQYCFNPELVDREQCCAGPVEIREDLRRGKCPSQFTNDEEHRRKRAFLIDVFRSCQKTLPSVLSKELLTHLEEWSRIKAVADFEDRVSFLVCDVMTEAIFGTKLDSRLAFSWGEATFTLKTWIPIPGSARKHSQALTALPLLLQASKESPKYDQFVQLCGTHGLEVEDGIINLLYGTIVNGIRGMINPIVASIACLNTITGTEKNDLLETTLKVLEKHGNISEESVGDLKSLEGFILEVLRLHPTVANFWGVAKKDFVITAGKESVQVRKGEQLLGSCTWAQLDASAFPHPERFECRRFMDEEGGGGRREDLLFFRGRLTEVGGLDSRQCPGPGMEIALYLIPAVLAVWLCYCSWELKESPVWSGEAGRFGKPDDPVSLTFFNFDSDKGRRVLGNM